jgi:hypothetical protein
MKIRPKDRTLESFKIFPFVAWALVLGFSFFIYKITTELQTAVRNLEIQTEYLQETVNTPVSEIKDFNGPTTSQKTKSAQ